MRLRTHTRTCLAPSGSEVVAAHCVHLLPAAASHRRTGVSDAEHSVATLPVAIRVLIRALGRRWRGDPVHAFLFVPLAIVYT